MGSKKVSETAQKLKDMANDALTEVENQMKAAPDRLAQALKNIEETADFAKKVEDFGKNFIVEEVDFEEDFQKLGRGKSPNFYSNVKLYGKILISQQR